MDIVRRVPPQPRGVLVAIGAVVALALGGAAAASASPSRSKVCAGHPAGHGRPYAPPPTRCRAPKRSRTSGATVSRNPTGPPTPSGGWSVAYADGFGAPLGNTAGKDNTLFPNPTVGSCGDSRGFNNDEFQVFNCDRVVVNSQGLNLNCTYASGAGHFYDSTQNYVCGAVSSVGNGPAGYRFFNWKPGQGQQWAIEAKVKLPLDTGEADPGWWTGDPPWTEEIDFLEGFGGAASPGQGWCDSHHHVGTAFPAWIYDTNSGGTIYATEQFCGHAHPTTFNPSTGFHTYTVFIRSNNCVSAYVDGHIQAWEYVPDGGSCYRGSGGTQIGPPPYLSGARLGLLLSYALRGSSGNPDPYFKTGTRTFAFRSIAIYENASAGDANAWGGGVAPGTKLQ